MHTQAKQVIRYFSRRFFLQSLAGFALATGIEGCTQTTSSSVSTTPTPKPQAYGKVLLSYRGHRMRVTAVAWSPNGTYIASGSLDKTVQVWAATSDKHFQPVIYQGHHDGITAVDWSPNSQHVVSASYDTTVQVWDALTGMQSVSYRHHTAAVMTVAWSPNGQYIASGSADGMVHVWDAVTGKQHYVYRGHTDSVNTLCWSPDSQHLASGSTDKTVQIIDAATGQHTFTYRGHTNTVSSVSWSPDGTHLASGSWDKTVQVWNADTGKVAYIYQGYNVQAARTNDTKGVLPDLVFVVAWSHNGKRIVAVTQVYCGDNCGVVVSWDADTERNVKFYIDAPVFALAWSPDDTRFVTALDVTTQGTGPIANPSDPEAGSYAQINQA